MVGTEMSPTKDAARMFHQCRIELTRGDVERKPHYNSSEEVKGHMEVSVPREGINAQALYVDLTCRVATRVPYWVDLWPGCGYWKHAKAEETIYSCRRCIGRYPDSRAPGGVELFPFQMPIPPQAPTSTAAILKKGFPVRNQTSGFQTGIAGGRDMAHMLANDDVLPPEIAAGTITHTLSLLASVLNGEREETQELAQTSIQVISALPQESIEYPTLETSIPLNFFACVSRGTLNVSMALGNNNISPGENIALQVCLQASDAKMQEMLSRRHLRPVVELREKITIRGQHGNSCLHNPWGGIDTYQKDSATKVLSTRQLNLSVDKLSYGELVCCFVDVPPTARTDVLTEDVIVEHHIALQLKTPKFMSKIQPLTLPVSVLGFQSTAVEEEEALIDVDLISRAAVMEELEFSEPGESWRSPAAAKVPPPGGAPPAEAEMQPAETSQ